MKKFFYSIITMFLSFNMMNPTFVKASEKREIKSNKNIIAQVIDDTKGVTIAYASSLDKEVKTKYANKEAAKEVGALIAKRALEKNIKDVVFDRGGYIYHGVVKELAEAARNGGLNF